MIVAFDTNILSYIIHPDAGIPYDPKTNQPVKFPKNRVENLLGILTEKRAKIIVPAPVLSELLTLEGNNGNQYLTMFQSNSNFIIAPFDTRAAIENAEMYRTMALTFDNNQTQQAKEPRQKVKVDSQIIAISRVSRVSLIYTDDEKFRKRCQFFDIPTQGIADLPNPEKQIDMFESDE